MLPGKTCLKASSFHTKVLGFPRLGFLAKAASIAKLLLCCMLHCCYTAEQLCVKTATRHLIQKFSLCQIAVEDWPALNFCDKTSEAFRQRCCGVAPLQSRQLFLLWPKCRASSFVVNPTNQTVVIARSLLSFYFSVRFCCLLYTLERFAKLTTF